MGIQGTSLQGVIPAESESYAKPRVLVKTVLDYVQSSSGSLTRTQNPTLTPMSRGREPWSAGILPAVDSSGPSVHRGLEARAPRKPADPT